MRSIFLALPAYGGVEQDTAIAIADAVMTARKGSGRLYLEAKSMSLLAMCFNTLWCRALNTRKERGLTHFVMLHGDIAPESGWLSKLLDEMDACGADILSAVAPIKDDQGITSTAVIDRDTKSGHHRLSYEDLDKLPATFDASHWPGKRLLINTGLMAVDFRKPWVEKAWFEIVDKIHRLPDGTFEARTLPEDWHLSLQAADLGAKVMCTQKITLTHWGRRGWRFEAKMEDGGSRIEEDVRAHTPSSILHPPSSVLCPCGGTP